MHYKRWRVYGTPTPAPSYEGAAEWRAVIGLGGLYEVSSEGQVRRVAPGSATRPGRVLKERVEKNGYSSVIVALNTRPSKSQRKRIHRLVAEVFLPNPEEKPEVNHLDLNKQNNVISNLEWVTRTENAHHAALNGLYEGRLAAGITKINKVKTHCPQGHAYDEANTKIFQGRRYCRACHRANCLAYVQRKRAATA